MPTQQDYQTARKLALDTLAKLDIEGCCIRAGLSVQAISPEKKRVPVPYLGRTYDLIVADEKICFDERPAVLKIPDQVVLLHYLITATGAPVQNRWITFREVPSGPFYYPAFVKRAISPLIKCFGQAPEMLEKAGESIGRGGELPGDTALKVTALPRVPIVLSLWKGDSEFPPEGNVYFDTSVPFYLPTEDIAYLAGAVVYSLIGVARNMTAS